jgi:hypothetical protein
MIFLLYDNPPKILFYLQSATDIRGISYACHSIWGMTVALVEAAQKVKYVATPIAAHNK